MNSRTRTLIIAIVFVGVVVWFLSNQGGVGLIPGVETPREVSAAMLLEDVKSNRVEKIVWDGDRLTAQYKDGSRKVATAWQWASDPGGNFYRDLTQTGFNNIEIR
ncbi:MAG: hypothetical protein C4340_03710, partial [Armatimonadota bacterium]